MYSLDKVDTMPMVRQYIETALWSTTDESTPSGGEPLNRNYDLSDVHQDTLNKMVADCQDFVAYVERMASEGKPYAQESVDAINADLEQAGHDFWLTRNGHGAGFWDGDYEVNVGKLLTDASKTYGEVNLYVGDDGMIHQY